MGYGDSLPATNNERLLAMVILLMGGIAQASIFGNIAVLLRGYDRLESTLRQQLGRIHDLSRVHGLPDDMAARMARSATLQWNQVQGKDYQTALKGLSDGFVAEVLESMACTKVVAGVPLFRGFPPGFVARLVRTLRLQTFLEGEVVIDEARGRSFSRNSRACSHIIPPAPVYAHAAPPPRAFANLLSPASFRLPPAAAPPLYSQGETGREMFFVLEGTLLVTAGGSTLATIEAEGFFGEIDLILGQRRTARVHALEPCALYIITRDELDEALEVRGSAPFRPAGR